MPKIRSMTDIANKWGSVTPQRTQFYQQGVEKPLNDWEENTMAGEQAYAQGVQQAAAEGRFGRGVSKVGTEKWKKKATTKGVQRWAPGVQGAQDDFAQGFAPYADVIEGTTLPPRYSRGDPRNMERSAAMARALAQARIQGT